MSGPKVVNIQALRRQQQRESAARLRELNTIIDECLSLQNTGQVTTSEFHQQTAALLTSLNGLREAGLWVDLVAQTTSYRDFYQQEAVNLRHRTAERRTAALCREHRLRQSAAQLADALNQLPPSSERNDALQKLITTQNDAEGFAAAAAEAADLVARTHHETAATENAQLLRALAATYAEPEASVTTQLLSGAAKDPDELRLDRCWSLLGELEAHDPTAAIEEWKQKARTTSSAVLSERGLLLDSLVLELTTHVRAKRAHQIAKAAIEEVLAELEGFSSPEAEVWRAKLLAAIDQPILSDEEQALVESARAWITQENAREDAQEQRAAVLRALTALGYEVREGMSAAWTEQGRVVVHKPNEPLYGVEFSAPATGTAFQTRVVAVGEQQRSSQRDREVEETWCSEFARLRALLAEGGFETNLAKAHQPGAIPIKTVASREADTARNRVIERENLSRSAGS